jgi:hypothetical protein
VRRRGEPSSIYFIRPVGSDGPVKIGHSFDPHGRLETYLAWSPVPLEVAAVLPVQTPSGERGFKWARQFERRFHARYNAHWLHHEWFAANPLLTHDIHLIRAGRFDLSVLPQDAPPICKTAGSRWQLAREGTSQKAAA